MRASSVGLCVASVMMILLWSSRATAYSGGAISDIASTQVAIQTTGVNGSVQIARHGSDATGQDHPPLHPPVDTPEPSSLALFGTGLVGLMVVGRKKLFSRGRARPTGRVIF